MLKDISCALAFVESPFQLQNLLDIAQVSSSTHFKVVVRLNGDEKNDSSLLLIISSISHKNVIVRTVKVSRKGVGKPFHLFKLCRYIFDVLNNGHVIFFDDRSLFFKVLNGLVRGKIFLADDGAYSFVRIAELEIKKDKRITGFITRFKGIESTCLKILYVPYETKRLQTKNYSLVVGMPLFEKGIVSKEAHMEIISYVMSRARVKMGNEVYYFPHRSEFVYEQMHLPLIKSEMSVEDYIGSLSTEGKAPSHIVSLYSTALFVISSKFVGPKCYYYRLPSNLINKGCHNISIVYEALKNSSCEELQ